MDGQMQVLERELEFVEFQVKPDVSLRSPVSPMPSDKLSYRTIRYRQSREPEYRHIYEYIG